MNEFFNGSLDSYEEIEELENNKISFLDNAKQIGETPTGIHIYLEDYVYTYLYQYAKLNRGEEKGAALVGYYTEELGNKLVVICGAIQFKNSSAEDGILLTEEIINEVQVQMDKYFPNCELIGWMHTQPGYGIFLTTQDIRLQKQYFPEFYQLLMIIDPIENTEAFFLWDEEEVRSAEGYYIYYDKNEQMQNYMVNHRVGVSNEEVKEKEEDVVMHFRKKDRERRQQIQSKKITHLVTYLSIVLFLMCVSMAVGLIQHRERLSKLETELNDMDSNYTDLLSQLKEEDVQVVFAENETAAAPLEETSDMVVEETEDTIIVEEKAIEDVEEVKEEVQEEVQEESQPEESKFDTYIVKRGDNLNRICYQHYKTTDIVAKIVETNNLESADKIYEGQVLKLPRL